MKSTDMISIVDALRVYLALCLDRQVRIGTIMRRDVWLKAEVRILNRTGDPFLAVKRSIMEAVAR